MKIYQQALKQHLKKHASGLYVLIGDDPFLTQESVTTIKAAWEREEEVDCSILDIQSPQDWTNLPDLANSYTLLASRTLVDIRFNKKTIDKQGKEILKAYLAEPNEACLLLLQAPQTNSKQWSWLVSHALVTVVHITPLTASGFQSWINAQLSAKKIAYTRDVPETIQRFTENNLVAAHQTIEKLALTLEPNQKLTVDDLITHMAEQAEFQLYALSDACLLGQLTRCIQVIRHAKTTARTELTLVLWLLTQEIRHLIRLHDIIASGTTLADACKERNIWPKKSNLYARALKRLSSKALLPLLAQATRIDKMLKSSQQSHVWSELEILAQGLCEGEGWETKR